MGTVLVYSFYKVEITKKDVNYRKGAGDAYESRGFIKPGIYTIIDEDNGWGLLKAYGEKRNGWIQLKYTEKV